MENSEGSVTPNQQRSRKPSLASALSLLSDVRSLDSSLISLVKKRTAVTTSMLVQSSTAWLCFAWSKVARFKAKQD
jgi:hypothetical protein